MKKRVRKPEEVFDEKHPIIQKKVEKSLKLSIQEGNYAAGMSGMGVSYLTPYALALKATDGQIGILNALITFLPSLIQLKATKFVERFSRKKLVIIPALLQALMFIPIILTAFLFYFHVPHVVWILIGFISIFYALGAIANPAWFSWMGSLVPENKRGEYFSRRNKVTGFFGLVAMIIGAVILDYSKRISWMNFTGWVFVGFGFLFFISLLLRFISLAKLARQYEPRLKVHKKDYFTFWQFLKRAPQTPFGRFSIYVAIMKIAINIAGPFWAVYMLKDLGFSYVWFMLVTVAGTLFQLLFYPFVGKFSDRFGNALLLKVSTSLMAIIPVLWIVSAYLPLSPIGVLIYLIFVPHILAGFCWAGLNLSTNNYIYDAVKQEKRCYGVVYFNFLNGIGMFMGAGIGALLTLINISFMNTLLFVFGISAVARWIVFSAGSKYLKEVRPVKRFSKQFVIREFRPVEGLVREVHHLNNIGEKILHYI